MKGTLCKFCGKDSTYTDIDYLVGSDHLSCVLSSVSKAKTKKVMKIKNWNKISGFTYKGYTIVNPICEDNETKYYAEVLDLNQPHKPKLELVVIAPGHRYKAKNDKNFDVVLFDGGKIQSNYSASEFMMSSVSNFRSIFEKSVDEILKLNATSAVVTSTPKVSSNGILNVVNNSANNITLSNSIGHNTGVIMQSLYDRIKELEQELVNLKRNTPLNPF